MTNLENLMQKNEDIYDVFFLLTEDFLIQSFQSKLLICRKILDVIDSAKTALAYFPIDFEEGP